MNKDLSYCIVLSQEQLSYLAGSKYGIDRRPLLRNGCHWQYIIG